MNVMCKSAVAGACVVLGASASYSFIALGDWGGTALGGYHSKNVEAVARQMGVSAGQNQVKFVVNVGDNFYYCGIQNTSDPQLQTDYLSIYTAPALQVPWYSALGNHEYGYNVEAQLDFTQVDPTRRWFLPARYYSKRVQLAAGQYLTLIVMDTSPCVSAYRSSSSKGWDPCGSEFPTCAPVDEGNCHFHENILSQDCSAQRTWLQETLTAVPQNDWLVVVGHHPADEIDIEDFTSLIQHRGFDLYLCGHVHALQQFSIDNNGAYVISGAGAMVHTADQDTDERCKPSSGTSPPGAFGHSYTNLWESRTSGFTLHTFNEDFSSLQTDFVAASGETLHSFTVQKSKPPSPTPTPPSPPPSPSCGGAGAYPCKKGCTYIHKAAEEKCGVQSYGCYDCSKLPKGCPDCKGNEGIFV